MTELPAKSNSFYAEDVGREAVKQGTAIDTTQIKHSVEFLNGVSSNNVIKKIVKEIKAKIKAPGEVKVDTDEVDAEIKIESGEKGDVYNIKFTDIKIKPVHIQDKKLDKELAELKTLSETLKKVQLFAHRKKVDGKEEYKFGAKFGEDEEEFTIGGDNEKLPYRSQVSALEDGFDKNLALIATATGSGKTITKLMFALIAKLRGMDVVSVNPRADLVGQEYEEQKGAVSKLGDINYDGSYKKEYKHNVVSLETFFNNSNEILDFSEFSKLLEKEGVGDKEFKVDLKNKRITIGGNIKIYKDYYTIGSEKHERSIFNDRNLLLMLDEVQDMVDKGEAYYKTTQLLLLLAHWKKINLVITTATPPVWMKDYIKEEKEKGRAHIESQSLQQKIKLGIGARIDIKVCNNVEDSGFVNKYVEYHNKELLERRPENDEYYYGPKKDSSNIKEEIRKYIIWNMQSVRNRMTLACIDSDQAQEQLKECLWREKKSSEIEKFLYNSDSYDSTSEVKGKLLGQFGKENEEAIDEVLQGFDYKGSIVDSGTFAVEHGIINNVISCIIHELDKDKLENRLSELDNQRFSNIESFREKVKKAITKLKDDDQAAYENIEEYVKGLNINNDEYQEDIESAMKTVWEVLKKSDEKRLNELLDNHNLSKEIHRMMPPDLKAMFPSDSEGSDNLWKKIITGAFEGSDVDIRRDALVSDDKDVFSILNILEKNRSAFFGYLKEHYETGNTLTTIEEGCNKLYREYKEAKDVANEYDRTTLKPAESKFKEAKGKHSACETRIKELKEGIRKAKGADQNKIEEMRKELQEARTKQPGLEEDEKKAAENMSACQTIYKGKKDKAEEKGKDLISKFREIIKEFESKEKYPLRGLRKICEKLSVYEAKGKDECAGDKLSKVGLVGYYFNWERKSGYNNQVLHNVLMRETVEDNIENKKQCVGRGGRKNGPIISLSYVDSAKVNNPEKTRDQLINGDPFDSLKEVKHKIDTKKYAERMVKKIEEVIASKYPKKEVVRTEEETKFINEEAYNALIDDIFKHILDVRHDIYNRCGYSNGRNEANKCFYQVLKSATSTLKKQLDQKGIVVGDCEIELGIEILKEKIDDLFGKHEESSCNIKDKQEEKDKVSNKLKIEGNFLKVIIIKFCTLVLRLWYRRFTLDKSQVEKVLEKDDKLTFKERAGLVREENKIKKEEAALQKVKDRQESEMEDFKKEKIDLQKQYNKMHQFIGIKEIKDNVKQEEITEGYKKRVKEEQLRHIASELKDVRSRLRKNESDVGVFNELDRDVAILEGSMASLRGELEKIVCEHEQLAEIKRALVVLRNGIIGNLSAGGKESLKDRMGQITESLHNCKLMNDTDKDKVKGQINDLYAAGKSEEQNSKLAQDIFEQLLSYVNVDWVGQTSVGQKGKDTKGRTKFEKLYNTIEHKINGLSSTDLASKGLQCNLGNAKELLKYFDGFAEEKKKIEEWQEKKRQLEDEKKQLSNDATLMDICRRLKVSESINKNYDVRRIIWLGAVLPEFLTKFQSADLREECISSPVFLEFFTNIVAPLANEGNLKIALDIFDPSGNSSKNGADEICKFYQSLLNKDFSNVEKKNIDNVLNNTAQLCVLIVLTKLGHHADAFSKDLELINSLTFGLLDLMDLIRKHIGNEAANKPEQDAQSSDTNSNNGNRQKDILLSIAQKLFSSNQTAKDVFNNFVKGNNPMSKKIRGNHFNTGTTLFTTVNFIMRAAAVAADYKAHDQDGMSNKAHNQDSISNKVLGFLGDSSIRRAKEEIAKLGKDMHKEVTEKYIYEYLKMFETILNGSDRYKQLSDLPDNLPSTLSYTCRTQEISRDYKKASQGSFPASLIASPNAKCLDIVQEKVALGG